MGIRKREREVQLSYLEELHSSSKGYITRAEKILDYKQWHFQYLELIMQDNDKENIYISMNTFFSTYRRLEYLKELKALFLDVDVHKTELTKEQVLMALDSDYLGKSIPHPTFIVDSGRGLYLIWLINKVPSNALPLWNAVQKFFYNKLKELGADRMALDATRILRVPGSINSKSGTEVKILEEYDYVYDLREIQENYLPELTPKPKTDTKKKRRVSKVARIHNAYTLHYARLQDITKLCELRDWNMTGIREVTLFLYRYWSCCFLSDKEEALRQTEEFNSMFTKPLVLNSVRRHTRSAEKAYDAWATGKSNGKYKRAGYNYKNETLIEMFSITIEEQKEMKTIFGEEEYKRRKRNRDNIYQKKKYEEKLKTEGKAMKKQAVAERRAKIKDLLAQGLKQSDICTQLDISKRTYLRDRQFLKEQGLI